LYEPAQPFFSKSQEVGWNGSRWEDVLLIPHGAAYHSLKKWNKLQDSRGSAGNRGGTLL
jgi:hypothetical protein